MVITLLLLTICLLSHRAYSVMFLLSEWHKVRLGNIVFLHWENTGQCQLPKVAKIILNNILKVEEQKYGIEVPESEREGFGARFRDILLAATAQTGKQVVVLIDEYDAPMHDSVSDEDLQKTIRNIMRDFFSPLKQQEGNIRFVFITGISKFSQLSIFSELNNLKILTLKDEYSSCCGITKSELTQYFREGIEEMAEHNGLTYEEILKAHR